MSDLAKRKKAVQRPNKTILSRTLFLLAVCGVAAFVILAIRLYEVQINKHDYYENLALEQQLREAKITASRGTIYDTNGSVLAMSATVDTVFVSPVEMRANEEDPELIASGLSELLGVDRDSVLKRLENSNSWYEVVKRKIEQEDAIRVREFIKENKLTSVHLEVDSKRYYPNGSLACQVLGFVGMDNDGLEGLEKRFDEYLTGTNGRVVRLKNSKGTDMLFSDYEDFYDAQDGDNAELTIDKTVQYYVEKHLAQAIEDYDVQKGGACIAMNPKTGEILAMASFNNFDPNNYSQISDKEMERLGLITDEEEYQKQLNEARFAQWRNKALLDTYEPGSVFKIITLAMGLEEGVISEKDNFNCGGSMSVSGRTTLLHCWRREGHGMQTLAESISNSCNIALTNIGIEVGATAFWKYTEAFGLHNKTGIELGEGGSIWWDKDDFINLAEVEKKYSSLAPASFGQTFNITPIQMITAVAAAINGGDLMQPYIVRKITAQDGSVVMSNEPTIVRQAISGETSDTVKDILVEVVEKGTGKNAQVPGYKDRIGGKTGTSEKTAADALKEENAPKEYIVSFCGFAPADDPQVVVLLLLDSPSNASGVYVSGGAMAAPVVGHMLADILPHLGVAPQYSEEELRNLNVSVPRLTSKSVEEAKAALNKQGLEFKIIGNGDTVTAQLPAANAIVASDTKVLLYTEGDAPGDIVTAPNLSGKSYSAAKEALESRGLFIRTAGALKSDIKARVTVQSAQANSEVTYGTVVEVTLIDEEVVELHE